TSEYIALPYHGRHTKSVTAVKIAPTYANVAASASADKTVHLWKLPNPGVRSPKVLTPKLTITGHTEGINDISFTSDSRFLATASDDKTVRIWDVQRGSASALVELSGHTNFVFALAFNPSSNLLVTGGFDEKVKMWDPRTGACVSTIEAHSEAVTSVSINQDGTCIASSSFDGLVRLWDTSTCSCLRTFYAEGNPPVSSALFSPNGKFVLTGTLDDRLRLWNINNVSSANGGCAKTYEGHRNSQLCSHPAFVTADRSNPRIVSGSEDGRVHVYGVNSRGTQQVIEGHGDAVLAVDSSGQVDMMATGGMEKDPTVKFWAPKSARLV
ncbi:hypothetical protein TrRE_jg9760, partial [Triparma retinervis]